MARRLIVEIVGDASSLQRALGTAAGSADAFGSRMSAVGGKISSFGKSMTRDLTLPIVGIGVVATKSAVDFQNSMEMLHTQAGVSQTAVEGLSKSVLAMAGSVATTPEELSTGLFHLASQGLRGARALDALKIAAEGAKVGGANLEDVTNALGASIVSGIKGSSDFSKTMGQLNAIVGAGDMHMQDLADAMGTGLPAKAAVAGVSLRDVGAALAVFGDNNIRGAEAGTLLNSTIRLMAGPSKAAAKAMAEVGLSANQLGDDLRNKGIVGAISDLKDHLQGLSKTEQFAALTHMFGGRQAGGVMVLIDQLERLKTKVREVSAGGNQFASDWEAYTKTTAYHLASMGAQMRATGISIGDVLLPIVAKLADFIGGLARKFESLSPGVRNFIMIGAGVLAVIGPVVTIIGGLTSAIGGLATAFTFLAANPLVLAIAGVAALAAAIAVAVIWPDKLKSVLEHMGLSARAAGEVVDGLRDVFDRVKAAGEALVAVVRENWSTIQAVISGAVDIVRTIVTTAVTVIEALWHTFGSTLVATAKTYWDYVKDTIRNALEVARGIIDVIAGLIHGDWSRVWKGIEEIVTGALDQVANVLRTAVSLLGEIAQLIGTAIWKGIIQPIAHLAGELLHKIEDGISEAFHAIIGWVVGEAEHIGHAITSGIMSGIGNLGGGLLGSLKSHLGGALSGVGHFLGIGSPSRVAANTIGRPIAEGIILGYLEGISPLTGKITSTLRASLEQARAAIRGQQSQVADAWRQLADAVVAAFDKETEQGLERVKSKLAAQLTSIKNGLAAQLASIAAPENATSAQLQAMQDQDRQLQLQHDLANATQQVADAQKALNDAQASGDPAQIAAAQQQLADAQYNLTMVQRQQLEAQLQMQQQQEQKIAAQKKAAAEKEAALEEAAAKKRAQREEANYRESRKAQKKHLEDHLHDLGKALEQGKITWAKAHAELMGMLAAQGLDYKHAGQNVGEQFAAGIRKSLKSVESAMQELAKLVAQYLPHSPAEKGPLSKPIGWESYLMGGLPSAAAGVSSILGAGFSTPTGHVGAGGGARAVKIEMNVNVPSGFVGSPKELGDALAVAVSRSALNGHPLWRQVVRQATS